jgi:hypothetical protein
MRMGSIVVTTDQRYSVHHRGVVLDAQHPATTLSMTEKERINATATPTMNHLSRIFKDLCNLRQFPHHNATL